MLPMKFPVLWCIICFLGTLALFNLFVLVSFAITFWEMITRHKPCLDVDGDNVPHSYAIMLRMDKGIH